MAIKYNTDKSELLGEYEKLFADIKDEKISFLEIGIWEGGSLLWAKDYFKNGHILGIDLKLPEISDKRITMKVCDQNDTDKLNDLSDKYGQFDIIIDDGSHLGNETRNSFAALWKHVKPGGWYIIEDWDAYTIAPQFDEIAKFVEELLRFDCTQKLYFKNKKAYAAFQK